MKLCSVAIELTNRCNLNCKMCYARDCGRERGFMDWSLFKKIVDELKTLNIAHIALHYAGESTIHPRFCEMADYVGKNVGKFSISTNGVSLSQEVLLAMLNNARSVNFSIHEDNEPMAYENAKRLKNMRTGRFPYIGANVTHSPDKRDYHKMLALKWKDAADGLAAMGFIENMEWKNVPPGGSVTNFPFCHQSQRYIAILWNGKITFCCRDLAGELRIGDLTKNTIIETLKNPDVVKLKYQIATQTTDKTCLCSKCKVWQCAYGGVSPLTWE